MVLSISLQHSVMEIKTPVFSRTSKVKHMAVESLMGSLLAVAKH
jgi:hypothetical protein